MSPSQSGPSSEQKRSALEQVLESKSFVRADQLRRFLKYICEMEIAGRAQEITEYSIATEALGRSSQYTPGDDSTVRGRAHALRQKLQELYESEYPDAPIRVELRKGSYVPVFLERSRIAVSAPKEPLPTRPLWRRVPAWGWGFAAGAIAAGLVAFGILLLAHRGPSPPDPVLREAWGGMVNANTEVLVCIASPPAMLLKSFKPGQLPAFPRVMPSPKEVSDWYAGLHEADGGGDLYMQTTMNTMLSGDTLAATRAVQFLTGRGAAVRVLPEWGLRPLVLRGRNVLMIGSPNYSPYAARLLRNTPLSVRYDPVRREEVIADGPPEQPGTTVYRPKRDEFGELTQVYGLLTVISGRGNGSEDTRTIMLSGITSAGPQAAMEYFASTAELQDLRKRLAKDGSSGFPQAYQVVLKCGVDRSLALNQAYEAHRVISHPPVLD